MKRLLVVLLLALAAAGCGSDGEGTSPGAPPQTLPAAALPQLDSRARTLDAPALAADALRPAGLEHVLGEAGYMTGREREFFGRTTTFDHVVARTLVFEDAEGAQQYLHWLGGHGRDLLGRAIRAKLTPPGESGVVFTLVRCGSCKKELPTFLAGWRRDEIVLTLLAAGPGANPQRFSSLTRELDETLG